MRFKTVQSIFFLTLVTLTTLAFVALIQDFLLPIFWAVVLAIIFQPVQKWWCGIVRDRSSFAAICTILTVIVIVILPLTLVGLAISHEATNFYEQVTTGEIDIQAPVEYLERGAPIVVDYFEQMGVDTERMMQRISAGAVSASRFVASRALLIGQSALRVIVLSFLMLYVLFFFLRDGDRLVDSIVRALPLGDVRERRLFSKFAEVSRATIKGTLVVGVVQGGLGGLLFWILGLPAPVFWGVIMTLLSLLPAVGSALVWVPAAVILLIIGEIGKAVILIVVGTLIIGLVDNVLRPILVGRDTQMPDFLILLSTLGGLTVFGLSGFIIGPIIAAFFLVVWEMFADEYSETD